MSSPSRKFHPHRVKIGQGNRETILNVRLKKLLAEGGNGFVYSGVTESGGMFNWGAERKSSRRKGGEEVAVKKMLMMDEESVAVARMEVEVMIKLRGRDGIVQLMKEEFVEVNKDRKVRPEGQGSYAGNGAYQAGLHCWHPSSSDFCLGWR